MKKPCCEDVSNLVDGTREHGNGKPDLTVDVCRVCGARHFRLCVDPGRIGLRGSGMGDEPAPVLGAFSHPGAAGVTVPWLVSKKS